MRRAIACVIAAVLAWLVVSRFGQDGANASVLALGLTLLASAIVGWLCEFVRLPRMTGYLAIGLICGPAVANIISEPMARDLQAAARPPAHGVAADQPAGAVVGQQEREVVGEPGVVGVEEGDEVGVEEVDGGAARLPQAPVALVGHDLEREVVGPAIGHLGRAVGRAVVHHDDAIGRMRLLGDRGQRRVQRGRRLVAGDDDADGRPSLDVGLDVGLAGRDGLATRTDLAAWAAVAARLLTPGGRLFIYEGHPLDWVWDTEAKDYVLDQTHGDYFSDQFKTHLFMTKNATPRHRQWTLGQIVNAVIGAGLVIDQLHEYPEPFWGQFPHMPEQTLHRLPHTFALLAHKP